MKNMKERILKKKQKKESSNRWLRRQLNDEYYNRAKIDGFRSRSSYKLIQINEKFNFLGSRKSILDLGCSPGGWLQIADKFSPNNCKILGIDVIDLKKLPNITFLKKDIFDTEIINKIKDFFDNKKIDLLMSDMSPNSSGNKNLDHIRIVSLVERVLEIANEILDKDGILVSKIFQGGAQGELIEKMKRNLNSIKYFKPKASRVVSAEVYLVAKKK